MAHSTSRVALGPLFSEAARRLWIVTLRDGQLPTARRLEVSPSNLSRWLYGDRLPRTEAAVKIQKRLRINAALWSEKPREAFVPPPAAREAEAA